MRHLRDTQFGVRPQYNYNVANTLESSLVEYKCTVQIQEKFETKKNVLFLMAKQYFLSHQIHHTDNQIYEVLAVLFQISVKIL